MDGKSWYLSKTLWTNFVAILAVLAQSATGTELLDPEAQMALLAVINLVLRFLTGQPLRAVRS